MNVAYTIAALLLTVGVINWLFHDKLVDRRFLSIGVYTVGVGGALYVMSAVFNLPIVVLQHGVMPATAAGDAAVFASKFTILVGIIISCLAWFLEKPEHPLKKRE
jgi:hypothetical protein